MKMYISKYLIFFLILINAINAYTTDFKIELWNNDDIKFINHIKKNEYDRYLINACRSKKHNIAIELITKGANVNIKNNIGFTPLHYVACKGTPKLAELLINKGAKINAKGGREHGVNMFSKGKNSKITPLHEASSAGNLDIVKLLIDNGANIDAKQRDKTTPIHTAVNNRMYSTIEFLITKGANIDVSRTDKTTPTHSSVRKEADKILILLIANNANLNLKNKNGENPLEYAKRLNRRIATTILEKAESKEVQDLIKKGKVEEVISILTKLFNRYFYKINY